MPVTLRAAARSDVGLVRSSNQDSGYAGVRFLVVADGMGGHAGGDVASAVAVGEMVGLDAVPAGDDAPAQLAGAVARAQDALLRRVAAEPRLAGMGTTVTALLRSGDDLVLAHLGDSRGYLLHEGRVAQVTRDHTFVQRLVDEGRITAEEAEHHPQRNVILRVLGDVQSSPQPDVAVLPATAGDRWLLCSDGLPRVVSDETIGQTLRGVADVGECADALVQLALRAGAPDNVTCVVADLVASGDDDQPPGGDGGPGGPGGSGGADGPGGAAGSGGRAAAAALAVELVGAAADARHRPSVAVPTSPAAWAADLLRAATGRGAVGRAATSTLEAPQRHPEPSGPPPGRAALAATAPVAAAPAAARTTAPARSPAGSEDGAGATEPVDPRGSAAAATSAAPASSRARRRTVRAVLVLLVVVVVAAGAVLAARTWLGRQWFVGQSDGRVAVFTGLPQDVGPLRLSHLVAEEDLQVAELPDPWRDRVAATIPAADRAAAQQKVDELRGIAAGATTGTAPGAPSQGSATGGTASP